MNRSQSKIRNIQRANILLEQRSSYKKLTEACQRAPLPKVDQSNLANSKEYRLSAIKVANTLVSSGKFTLITENDGCGNYVQDSNSPSNGYNYYAPLGINDNTLKIINIDGTYSLEDYQSQGKIKCLITVKCGCSKTVGTIFLDPNDNSTSMINTINTSSFLTDAEKIK